MADQEGYLDLEFDKATLTATVVSEGVAIAYGGGLAATGANFVLGISQHKGVSGDVVGLVKRGSPAKLRVTLGQVLAVGDRLGIGATAGQFSKVAAAAGTGVLAISRGTTTGSGEEYVAADFDNSGFIEPAP